MAADGLSLGSGSPFPPCFHLVLCQSKNDTAEQTETVYLMNRGISSIEMTSDLSKTDFFFLGSSEVSLDVLSDFLPFQHHQEVKYENISPFSNVKLTQKVRLASSARCAQPTQQFCFGFDSEYKPF